MPARFLAVFTATLIAVALLVISCGPDRDPGAKPKGTLADPVEVCERLADVCRIDDSRLGVCEQAKSGVGLFCAPQH